MRILHRMSFSDIQFLYEVIFKLILHESKKKN